MTSAVLSRTPDGAEEFLAHLRDLIPGTFFDGDPNRDAMIEDPGLVDDSISAFSFIWSGIDCVRHDAPVSTADPIVPDENKIQRLYLVSKTKVACNLDNLNWSEAMRIRFASSHFGSAPSGLVDYNHTTDKAGLLIGPSDELEVSE